MTDDRRLADPSGGTGPHARPDRSRPRHLRAGLTACARAWGFTGPSHFTRRFRAAYGVTPRRLRAAPPGPAE
ncbi:AraC family transcriptional regulator [Streptomyces levis]|uniref:AraC family transcriptional regulator n=1 Tax=Streptomyces levis TaxID=285566 RepID=UPI0031D73695